MLTELCGLVRLCSMLVTPSDSEKVTMDCDIQLVHNSVEDYKGGGASAIKADTPGFAHSLVDCHES
jgi:hypothetical protein